VNIALAVLLGLAFKAFVAGGVPRIDAVNGIGPIWPQFLFVAGYANVILAAFNLIPLPPLDGSAVLERVLPASLLPGYYRIRPFTIFLPLILIILDQNALGSAFNWVFQHYANAVV
jgi:Zn-dependent protease